ncbi:molybdopterin synthase sulfur carrier subunit [Streptosporangium sp. NPDC020145]|uniref:Molybdopterin synthase sulfur carrier subunit n=1 Tax=Streptosporangium jomthongense TaxID=1193683 RepID=A0ABV8EYJ4_9ACTN
MTRSATLVTFVFPSALGRWAGDMVELRVFAVADRDGGRPTLGAALDTLCRTHPSLERRLRDDHGRMRRHISVFVCGENARGLGGLACALPPAAEVHLLPVLSRVG